MNNNPPKKILQGTGASSGTVTGTVTVVSGDTDTEKFQEGNILVTRITDPSMVIMMGMAGGIICDIGSIASHPSIVSRELGIPCIVNAKHATTLLHDGMSIRMNGATGEIFSLQ